MSASTNPDISLQGNSLFFLNSLHSDLESAIKHAAIELSKVKTQSRISQKPKSIYIHNTYKDTQISFMYDFYKETDIDSLKIFLENFYEVLEEIFIGRKPTKFSRDYSNGINLNVMEQEPIKIKKEIVQPVKREDSLSVSINQMNDLQKNMLSTLKSLMVVNQNFKGYIDNQAQLLETMGMGVKERSRFSDQNKQGKKLLDAFHGIFESFEKSLRLLADVSTNDAFAIKNSVPAKNAQNPLYKHRNNSETGTGMGNDLESNVYASGETFAKRHASSPRNFEDGVECASRETNTEINSTNLETNYNAIGALMYFGLA